MVIKRRILYDDVGDDDGKPWVAEENTKDNDNENEDDDDAGENIEGGVVVT